MKVGYPMSASLSPFNGAPSSIVFQSSSAMNGKIPSVDAFTLAKQGKGVFASTATDTGGIWLQEPIVLESIVVHSGSATVWIENLDGSADLSLNVTLVAGFNHMDNRIIPAGTILKIKSSGAAIVEVVGKLARSSFSI